ncbi:unnamed protein product [Blepharisma stoltei]|uniref:Uncharacterized protein n=1 Tax=Blepharisma stoltei TaxID=1481888 RepID=A0AAU9JJH3_9CILI|nr:unnamed protein product [Blepharisma stoltei]
MISDVKFQRNSETPNRAEKSRSMINLDYKPAILSQFKEKIQNTSRGNFSEIPVIEFSQKENLKDFQNKSSISFHDHNKSDLCIDELKKQKIEKSYRNTSLSQMNSHHPRIIPMQDRDLNFKILKYEEDKRELNKAQEKLKKDQSVVEKQLNIIDRKLTEMQNLKEKLDMSIAKKNENIRAKEDEIFRKEKELAKERLLFEEEKQQWETHIAAKLKDIINREKALESDQNDLDKELERSKQIGEKLQKIQLDIKEKTSLLDQREKKFLENEDCYWKNNEKFQMMIEDINGCEDRIVEYEGKLLIKENALIELEEEIEEKRLDIEKTSEMFEDIDRHLKEVSLGIEYEKNQLKIQWEELKTEKSLLKDKAIRIKLKNEKLKYKAQNISYQEEMLAGRKKTLEKVIMIREASFNENSEIKPKKAVLNDSKQENYDKNQTIMNGSYATPQDVLTPRSQSSNESFNYEF